MSNSNSTGGYLFIAIAIVVAAWLLGGALVDFKQAGDTISVTGSAKRAIVSDLIIWRGELYSQQPTKQV
ncbi:SIMPL domain-containing protein, partial [bacterium]|nr:SIMPL domain-containing protein [bacterium]